MMNKLLILLLLTLPLTTHATPYHCKQLEYDYRYCLGGPGALVLPLPPKDSGMDFEKLIELYPEDDRWKECLEVKKEYKLFCEREE